MSQDASWKDKYLKELEAAEAREAQWDTEKNLLQRMLVRTSLASEGQSPELDSLLMRLREQIRKGNPDPRAWQDIQEQIDRKVSVLDDQKAESDRQLRMTFERLLSELRREEAFRPVREQLKDLNKRLRKPETLRQSFAQWLQDFAAALKTGLGSIDQEAQTTPQKGLLGRLFGKPGAEEPAVPVAEPSDARDTALMIPIEPEPIGQDEPDQRLRLARRVGELLGQLLEQVTLDPAAELRARRLQETLLASHDWDELRDGLAGVAELVISAVTRSQREFETFLRRLDERLGTLKTYFSEQENARAGRLGASAELDVEIQRELQAFDEKVNASNDFQSLRASVSGHLASIREAVGRFRAKETEREKAMSEQLAILQEKMVAMEEQAEHAKSELREQRQRALTDVLTQLPNREAWQERLDLEFQRWRRYANPLTLAVVDIDLFKRVNDSYGHQAGDRVLQLVARALVERLRQTDFVARFGGEEFVMLFPETAPDEAKKVLDALRTHVKNLPFHFRGEPVSVSFSAGVAGFVQNNEPHAVFDRADKSLYAAKEAGRDQVCIAAPG